MKKVDLVVVLSGHICRPQSVDMRPFWNGFIELQRKLPVSRNIKFSAVHSWNPEFADLVKLVYAPDAECHEDQNNFYPEFLNLITPPDYFENGLDRLNSTWKNVTIQGVLGNARSRARAIKLLIELELLQAQVLITRWDLGQTGSSQVNQLVADAALPVEYTYLAYFSEVDEGYADMWMLIPWADALRFSRFDTFVLDSLAGRNRYLELFSESAWPRARIKTRFEAWRSQPIGRRLHALASKLVNGIHNLALGHVLVQRAVRRLVRPVQSYLTQPPFTAENSCLPGFETKPAVFPTFQALNIHALLKFFILSEGLRDRVRFLTCEDFELSAQCGQLINPARVVLVVHEADDTAIARVLAESPLPLAAVYQVCEGKVRQHVPNGQGGWGVMALCVEGSAPRDLMACALDAELGREAIALPVLVMPTVERYLGCTDWFYMNALAKYLVWSLTGYVGLARSRAGKSYLGFPGIQLVRGRGSFNLYIAAGTAEGIRSFLDVADPDLNKVSDCADRMMLEFPVVVKDGGLF